LNKYIKLTALLILVHYLHCYYGALIIYIVFMVHYLHCFYGALFTLFLWCTIYIVIMVHL